MKIDIIRPIILKELIVGFKLGKQTYVYPFFESSKSKGKMDQQINQQVLKIKFYPVHNTALVISSNHRIIPSTISYWFAWMAFYPDSVLYQAERL